MPRVLVVEDVRSIRVLIRMILQLRGFDVDEAEHGGEAIALLEEASRCDLLITDLSMPDVDGAALIEWVRQRSTLPILVITGYTERCDEVLAAGANACLTKPFTAAQLVQHVQQLLAGSSSDEPP
jgi:CheY-like chemotaxis protein